YVKAPFFTYFFELLGSLSFGTAPPLIFRAISFNASSYWSFGTSIIIILCLFPSLYIYFAVCFLSTVRNTLLILSLADLQYFVCINFPLTTLSAPSFELS